MIDREEPARDHELHRDDRDLSVRGRGWAARGDRQEVDVRLVRGLVQQPDEARQVGRRGDLGAKAGKQLAVGRRVLLVRLQLGERGEQALLLRLRGDHLCLLGVHGIGLGLDEDQHHQDGEDHTDRTDDQRFLALHDH